MDHRSTGRYAGVDSASAFGRHQQQFADVSARPRFAVESPQLRAQYTSHQQQHRLMWTPELAIQEIVEGNTALPPLQIMPSASRPAFQGRQQQQHLDIKSFQTTSTSTPTTQATAALEFETTSAATRTIDRSLANEHSFSNQPSDAKWPSPYVVERTPLRSALAKKKPHPSSQPSTYRSRSARGLSEDRANQSSNVSLLASPQNESLQAVSPINIDLSNHHQLQPFSTPNPKYLPNDTTLSAGGARSDYNSPHSAAKLTPSMEVKILRKEVSDLRMQLVQEQQRSRTLADDLFLAKGELNNTSVHVDVRERECMELNDFVDTLQRRCRSLEIELSELRTTQEMKHRLSRLEQATSPIAAAAASPRRPDVADLQNSSNIIISSLEYENRELATRLAQATLEIAQMKAILDRLELHAPYPPELVGTAKKQLRLFAEIQ